VCATLVQAGITTSALVRDPAKAGALAGLGVELKQGDITDPGSLRAAAAGADGVIHAAALVPGGTEPKADRDYDEVNVRGTVNVIRSAEPGARIVVFSSAAALDRRFTQHEESPEVPDPVGDPYARTKRAADRLVREHVAAGRDVLIIRPPATIGPAPTGPRAIEPPGFNSRMLMAIQGKISDFPPMPLSMGLASDVATATLAALRAGRTGAVYLPWGRPDEVVTAPDLFNLACACAGVTHRVRALTAEDAKRPEFAERWGPAVLRAAITYPDPYFRNDVTVRELGYRSASLAEIVEQTTRFLLAHQ
jgi:dihydroflavonol-4-reductase